MLVLSLVALLPGVAPAAGSTAALDTWKVKALGIPANDVVYDPSRNVLLAVVGSRHSSLGNMLVELNPQTGAVGRRVTVGSEPRRVVLTGDRSTAYVTLGGANRIARVSLASFTVSSFSLGRDLQYGFNFANDIAVLPGRNDIVVASVTGGEKGVWAFKDGKPLPNRVEYLADIETIGPGTIAGYDSGTTARTLHRLRVDDQGVTELENHGYRNFGHSIEHAGGIIYGNSGLVVDAGTFEPILTNTIDDGIVDSLEATPENGRVTYVTGWTPAVTVFDITTGAKLGSRSLRELSMIDFEEMVAMPNGFAAASTYDLILMGPDVGGGPVSVPAPLPSLLAEARATTLDLPTEDLLYDAGRKKLYALTKQNSPTYPGQLVALDPATGKVLAALDMGGKPVAMDMTGDSALLYVAVSGPNSVRMVNLDLFLIAGQFLLDGSPWDLAVRPGTRDTLVVTVDESSWSPHYPGLAVYRGGRRLPHVGSDFSGPNVIEFYGPNRLYGSHTVSSAYGLFDIEIGEDGFVGMQEADQVWGESQFTLQNGKLYGRSGAVIDPAAVDKLGQYLSPHGSLGATLPVPELKRTFTLDLFGRLGEHDLEQHRLLGSLYPYTWDSFPGFDELVRVEGGLVAGGDEDLMVVRLDPLPPSPPPKPAMAAGWNGFGQLGNGTATDRTALTSVSGLHDVTQVAAGLYFSVALKADGTVWAWGWNGTGSLGDGTTTDRRTPVRVAGLTDVKEISAGFLHALAVKNDGTVWAWGWNHFGQLGDGTTQQRLRPVQVENLSGVAGASAGAYHNLARGADKSMLAWGWNAFGQLGDGTTRDRSRPVTVGAAGPVSDVAAGGLHSVAVNPSGNAWAWGWNGLGQLGTGGTADSRVPQRMAVGPVVDASSGYAHTLMRDPAGATFATGWNAFGQLGDGTTVDRHLAVPLDWQGDQISAGLVHNLAVDEGQVYAWGWNAFGQHGDGSVTDRLTPRKVGGTEGFKTVSAGALHSLTG